MLLSERFAEVRPGGALSRDDRVALDVLRAARDTEVRSPLGYAIAEIDLTGDLYLDLVTSGNLCLRLPRDRLGTTDSIASCLRLVAKAIATGRVEPGRTLIVGRDNRVTYQ